MKYSMTQLSMKQNLMDVHVKRANRLNALLAEMCVLDMDDEVLSAIEDICQDITKCAEDIKETAKDIKSYAFLAKTTTQKNLKTTLEAWERSKAANAAVLAEGKLPVINPDEDEDEYALSADAVNKEAF